MIVIKLEGKLSKMQEIIDFIISNFECNSEYIEDELYNYLKHSFAINYPKETKDLFKHYFPKRSSVNIDDLYEKIKDIVINEIIERNEIGDKYF